MLTPPDRLISPLLFLNYFFIEVHVVLSFVSPYFMWLSCLLDLIIHPNTPLNVVSYCYSASSAVLLINELPL